MNYQAYKNDSIDLDPNSPFFLNHISRYWWALQFCHDKEVLDAATGHGYGAYILSSTAQKVLGVDLNQASLNIALDVFKKSNLEFKTFDVLKLDILNRQFDIITAFEIFEHLPPQECHKFLAGIKKCLKKSGKLLLSTPNHDVVLKSGSQIPNFHINNVRPKELKSLLLDHFDKVTLLGQFINKGPLYYLLFSLDFFNFRHLLKKKARTSQPLDESDFSENIGPISTEHFKIPPKEIDQYIFSKFHWRQAGQTIAICQ